jgi:hypothetical protein
MTPAIRRNVRLKIGSRRQNANYKTLLEVLLDVPGSLPPHLASAGRTTIGHNLPPTLERAQVIDIYDKPRTAGPIRGERNRSQLAGTNKLDNFLD